MNLPVPVPLPPMEARSKDAIPEGDGWQYEPKWDGFRCLAFKDGGEVQLWSKASKPLQRYFPEVAAHVAALPVPCCVLDGELIVPVDGALSFDDLLQRIHPAESRIRKLARERPATYVVFDLLVDEERASLLDLALGQRRARLEAFAARALAAAPGIVLSPATSSRDQALDWYRATHGGIDGIIAKRVDQPYRAGEREGMVKTKFARTADCVVGGFRYGKNGGVGSLLLGLYDAGGVLHHVGFTSSLSAPDKSALLPRLEALRHDDGGVPGFTGRAPGGPSRWNAGKSNEWEALPPELVVEVEYDHVSGGRFRHGTRFLRWRPDKAPRQCTFEQIEAPGRSPLVLVANPADPRAGRG